MEFEGAIFDLDGTIADSLYVWKKVDLDFFNKRGLDVPLGYGEKISSMSFKEAAKFTKTQYLFKESIDEIMSEWYNMAVYEYSFNVRAKPYVKEYIVNLKKNNVKTALCTASPKELYEPFLKNNGLLSFFDTFVSGTETNRGKEYPDIYILAAERLGILPKKCVVFEDILKAVKGAKSAGMKVIGVFDSNSAKDIELIKKYADDFIYDFSEIIV